MQSRAAEFRNLLGQHSLQVFAFSMLITCLEAHTTSAFPVLVQVPLTLLTVFQLILARPATSALSRAQGEGSTASLCEMSPIQ